MPLLLVVILRELDLRQARWPVALLLLVIICKVLHLRWTLLTLLLLLLGHVVRVCAILDVAEDWGLQADGPFQQLPLD